MDLKEQQPSPPPPPASGGNGKIPVIKIKLAKKGGGGEKEKEKEKEEKEHVCGACNKIFRSGKALGGHMSSAHVQANKDYSYKTSNSKRKASSPDSDSGYSSPCPTCGKEFSSQKSLFGHMRCHPERWWRGMVPPPQKKDNLPNSSSSSSSSSSDRADSGIQELGFHLKKWPTSKRGRAPVVAAAPPPPPPPQEREEDEDESFAARLHLIKMLSRKEEEDDRPRPELNLKNGGKEVVLLKNQILETLIGDGINDVQYVTAIQVLTDGKRERKREEKEREREREREREGEMINDSYKCNECDRYFPTHQALGGHRSSHNKFKMSVVNTATRDARTPPPAIRRKKKKLLVKTITTTTTTPASNVEAASIGPFPFDLNIAPQDEQGMEIDDDSSSDA